MKHNKYTVLSFLGMLALSMMLVSCYSLWDDLSNLPQVTITYVSEKGTAPAPKKVNTGYKLTSADLAALTADGYNFKGWDKSVGDEITADTTITASWKKLVTITYSLPSGYSKEPKVVEEGYKLTAEDLPNIETNDTYYMLNKNVGYEITADTQITGDWDDIVYLKNFKGILLLASPKSTFEKTIFTEDTYTGDTTNTTIIDCSEDAHPGYFTGVISSDNKVFTIYGNGHRIYAPVDSSQLFSGFNKLNSIEFNNFYTSNVTNMSAMFASTKITSLDVSKFNTSKVTNMKDMFNGCTKLTELDISSFDTSSVLWTSMGGCGLSIFNGCSSLVTIYASDKFVSTLPTLTIFDGCTSLVGGTGTRYSDCETSDPNHYKTALYARIDGGSSNPGYFTLKQ